MEFDPRSPDRLPFQGPDEAEHATPGALALSPDAQRRHLQRVPLFSGFDAPAGTVITQIGDAGDSFFVIIDGMAAVQTPVGAGSQPKPGDFFGEMSLLDGEPRSATIGE